MRDSPAIRANEKTYRRAVEAARIDAQNIGTPTSDYGLMLTGLSAVLANTSTPTSPTDLSTLFHWPLATIPPSTPLRQVVDSLAGCLPTDVERGPLSIIDSSYHYLLDPTHDDEVAVRGKRRLLEQEVVGIERRVADRLSSAARLRRQAGVVEVLTGERTDGVSRCLAQAEMMEGEAREAREWVERMRHELDERLASLPTERAESLLYLSSLRSTTDTFGPGKGVADSRYITDGSLLLDTRQVLASAARRVEKLRQSGVGDLTEARMRRYLRSVGDVGSQVPAVVVGYFVRNPKVRGVAPLPIAVLLVDSSTVLYANASYLRLAGSLLGAHDVRVHTDEKGRRSIVLVVDGVTAAVLAPLTYTTEDIPIDVEVLRRRVEAEGSP